jgi:hypothetical protein
MGLWISGARGQVLGAGDGSRDADGPVTRNPASWVAQDAGAVRRDGMAASITGIAGLPSAAWPWLRRALLGFLGQLTGTLGTHQGSVCALPCLIGTDLPLSLAQRGHLRVQLLDLRVHDLADQHGRCTCIASSAAEKAARAAASSRSRCWASMPGGKSKVLMLVFMPDP